MTVPSVAPGGSVVDQVTLFGASGPPATFSVGRFVASGPGPPGPEIGSVLAGGRLLLAPARTPPRPGFSAPFGSPGSGWGPPPLGSGLLVLCALFREFLAGPHLFLVGLWPARDSALCRSRRAFCRPCSAGAFRRPPPSLSSPDSWPRPRWVPGPGAWPPFLCCGP